MTFTFRFTCPYRVVSVESRLERAIETAATNASTESDVSGYSGGEREYYDDEVTWTLNGVDREDLSQATREAIITAIQSELPGAADFEIVE
jgi:hypothetical protein